MGLAYKYVRSLSHPCDIKVCNANIFRATFCSLQKGHRIFTSKDITYVMKQIKQVVIVSVLCHVVTSLVHLLIIIIICIMGSHILYTCCLESLLSTLLL